MTKENKITPERGYRTLAQWRSFIRECTDNELKEEQKFALDLTRKRLASIKNVPHLTYMTSGDKKGDYLYRVRMMINIEKGRRMSIERKSVKRKRVQRL